MSALYKLMNCRVFFALVAVMPFIAVQFPRSMAFLPGVISVFVLGSFYMDKRKLPRLSRPLIWAVASITAVCGISMLWAIGAEEALIRILKLVAIFSLGCLLVTAAQTLREEEALSHWWFLPVGIVAASALVAVELLLDAPLFRATRAFDMSEPVLNHIFNRGTVTIVLCFFPVLAILAAQDRAVPLAILFTLSLLPMLVLVESQSAQLAVVLGLMTFVFFPYRSKAAWIVLAALIAVLIVGAPFLAIWLFEPLAATLNGLPFFGDGSGYAGARMEIWDYVSRYALNSPLYGFGLEASREIDNFPSNQLFQLGTKTLHPHNFAIQLWLEFGLIGALAGAAFCSYLLWLMFSRLTPDQRRAALPTFVACLSVSATGYGMWQSWWVGLLFLVTALSILATKVIGQIERKGQLAGEAPSPHANSGHSA